MQESEITVPLTRTEWIQQQLFVEDWVILTEQAILDIILSDASGIKQPDHLDPALIDVVLDLNEEWTYNINELESFD